MVVGFEAAIGQEEDVLGVDPGRQGGDGGAVAAALGIAAAAAVLAGILVGGTVAKDRSVAQDVERLPAAPRAVRASWFGVPAGAEEAWPTLDRQARAALAPLPAGDPVSIALVRESTIGGVFVGGSIFFNAAPDGGWFMYPPLSTDPALVLAAAVANILAPT